MKMCHMTKTRTRAGQDRIITGTIAENGGDKKQKKGSEHRKTHVQKHEKKKKEKDSKE